MAEDTGDVKLNCVCCKQELGFKFDPWDWEETSNKYFQIPKQQDTEKKYKCECCERIYCSSCANYMWVKFVDPTGESKNSNKRLCKVCQWIYYNSIPVIGRGMFGGDCCRGSLRSANIARNNLIDKYYERLQQPHVIAAEQLHQIIKDCNENGMDEQDIDFSQYIDLFR